MRTYTLTTRSNSLKPSTTPTHHSICPNNVINRNIKTRPSTSIHSLPSDKDDKAPTSRMEQARALDKLFYSSSIDSTSTANTTHPELLEGRNPISATSINSSSSSDEGGQIQGEEGDDGSPMILRDVPLWRVQWTMLPGFQEVLHVHVPHYCDMFNRLFETEKPWLFGHLLLPGGSTNLGNEDYALQPGTKAATIGTLMEVLQAVRFPDGRLLILAVGVGKFKVKNAVQVVPHSRADVEVVVDVEESFLFKEFINRSCSSQNSSSIIKNQLVVETASKRAAIAYNNAWLDYELSHLQQPDKPSSLIDATQESIAQEFGRRLIAIGANLVMTLPFASRSTSSSSGSSGNYAGDVVASFGLDGFTYMANAAVVDSIQKALSLKEEDKKEEEEESSSGSREKLIESLEAFLTTAASISITESFTTEDMGVNEDIDGDAASGHVEEEEEEEERKTVALPDTIPSSLLLEKKIWEEITSIGILSRKLSKGRKDMQLPESLLCLIPPDRFLSSSSPDNTTLLPLTPSSTTTTVINLEEAQSLPEAAVHYLRQKLQSSPETYTTAVLTYSPIRRLHRLSYMLYSLLPENMASLGGAEDDDGKNNNFSRQRWLEVESITERLEMGLQVLRRQRQVLAAVSAVENVKQGVENDDSSSDDD